MRTKITHEDIQMTEELNLDINDLRDQLTTIEDLIDSCPIRMIVLETQQEWLQNIIEKAEEHQGG
jgi:hypothetical protein